ncbi:MAG: hypothetical protein II996_04175 [Oscillospiraceae bacterium]|nr:hypothetical protein [Oscillospiraceae bacterium]
MNRIKFFFAKIRLALANRRAIVAKELMDKVIRSTRAKKEEIDYSYENFLKRCKQQEKAAIMLKRATNGNPDKPFLKIDLGIEHFTVLPDAANKLTRHDVEVAITRHRYGDWGEVSKDAWQCNNAGVNYDMGVICSRYPLFGGGFFNIETDKRTNLTRVYLGGEA